MASRRTQKSKYGETKKRYLLMLTETASLELDILADDMQLTRSEVFERLVRDRAQETSQKSA